MGDISPASTPMNLYKFKLIDRKKKHINILHLLIINLTYTDIVNNINQIRYTRKSAGHKDPEIKSNLINMALIFTALTILSSIIN